MKIYAISLVKNEEDIIEKNLPQLPNGAIKIYVFDNGSTDKTWEIVNRLKSAEIIPYKCSDVPYRDALRQEVFEYFRHELTDGDWVCFKMDADKFYIDDPRDFLGSLKPWISMVFGANIEYQFTKDNIYDTQFEFDNFKYALIPSCEQRFIKYRKKLVWNVGDSIPLHPGIATKKFIKFAHYQFRNREQITRRLNTGK
ncbi:MAG: glycosyltransferase family 2 protein [Chitinophagaceae bacterium]|nr:glycosyltransferase family 2 protein [Chitinophagaceae bacterium]